MPRASQARRLSGVAVSLALLAGAGCGKKSEPPGSSSGEPNAELASRRDAAAPAKPGRVLFAVGREGVVELVGGEFERIIESPGGITDLAITADGSVYAVADAQILRADGGAGEVVGDRTEPGVARRIAAAADGALWAIGGKGLWRREAGVWAADDTFPSPRTVTDITTTSDGAIVCAARSIAYVLGASGWVELELPAPPPEPKRVDAAPSGGAIEDGVGDSGDDGIDEEGGGGNRTVVRSLVTGADGKVYISLSIGVYRLEGKRWVVVTGTPVTALAIAADGTLIAAAESGAVLWGKPGAIDERDISAFGIAASELDAVATDSLGRVWLATDGGLVIADARGEPLAGYSAATQPGLPGRIVAIRVVDAPTVLPQMSERRTGDVIGQVVGIDRKSVAGVSVEACATPDTMFRGSPCAEAATRNAAITDDNGRFRFEHVPAGRYGFAIETDAKKNDWIVDLTIDCCTQLFTADEVDVKRISVLQ